MIRIYPQIETRDHEKAERPVLSHLSNMDWASYAYGTVFNRQHMLVSIFSKLAMNYVIPGGGRKATNTADQQGDHVETLKKLATPKHNLKLTGSLEVVLASGSMFPKMH